MKKTIALALAALMLLALLTACAAKPAETEPAELEQTVQTEQPAEPETDETAEDADASAEEETPAEPEQPAEPALPDGVYTADFNTDSSMFHANEACDALRLHPAGVFGGGRAAGASAGDGAGAVRPVRRDGGVYVCPCAGELGRAAAGAEAARL